MNAISIPHRALRIGLWLLSMLLIASSVVLLRYKPRNAWQINVPGKGVVSVSSAELGDPMRALLRADPMNPGVREFYGVWNQQRKDEQKKTIANIIAAAGCGIVALALGYYLWRSRRRTPSANVEG